MEIKGTRDMINYRNYLLTKVNIEYNKLEKLGNSPFTNRKEKNIISKNISDYRYELNSIEELMIKGSKFKSSDFAVFLEKFISLTENDVVTTTIKIADDAINERLYQKIRNTKDRSKLDKFIGKLYYFICDEETADFIYCNILDEYDLEQFMESEASKNIIVLDEYNTYPFKSNFLMEEQFSNHKRLKTAIYELIDLKIKYPELTDEERLKIVLENTIRRNLDKGYDNQKKKESK